MMILRGFSDGRLMVPLCSLVPLCHCQGSGFLVPFINCPLWSFSLHLLLFFPTQPPATTSTTQPLNLHVTMSPSATPMIPTAPLSSVYPQAVLENSYDHLRDQSINGGYMNYGSQVSNFEPTYARYGAGIETMLFCTHTLSFQNGLPLFFDPRMVERVFDYIGGHINDQSDLQGTQFHSLSSVNGHQDREIEALHLQTQELSVKFHHLLWDHIALIQHMWAIQNTLAINLFFRPLLPESFVLTLVGINGLGSDSSSQPSNNSNTKSSPSTPSQSFKTCASGGDSQGKVYAPWFDPSGWHPFGSLLSRVQSCTPSSPRQRIRMRLQVEVTNQVVLHGEEMVREVLMGMLQEMRPPPQHNAFEYRNCQWVERRGKMMLKPCENSPAFHPAPPPYEEDYCNSCLSFEDCPCPDP